MFEHSLVPGMLQTENYARATLAKHPDITEDKLAELLAARLARQSVLSRESPQPPVVWAVLDEGVLYCKVGGPEIMYGQLTRLVTVSELPNVTIQILPSSFGVHSGLAGAFIIADFAADPSILFVEDLVGGRVIEEAAVVARRGCTSPRYGARRCRGPPHES
jgi:hypothetical protein